jgi:hypothetical protein
LVDQEFVLVHPVDHGHDDQTGEDEIEDFRTMAGGLPAFRVNQEGQGEGNHEENSQVAFGGNDPEPGSIEVKGAENRPHDPDPPEKITLGASGTGPRNDVEAV